MDDLVLKIQKRLIEFGIDPGPADGVMGRKTIEAVTRFQKANNLAIQYPGTIGPKTLAALKLEDVEPTATIEPPWIAEAKKYLGLHEDKDAKTLDKVLKLDASETAWCGGFVGLCIASALPKEIMPTNPLGSRNWMKFGIPVDEYRKGNICVFWRGSKDGWQGHVGFVVGHDKSYVHCLAGNQQDKVSIAKIAKDRLLGMRWPSSYPMTGDSLAFSTINASITTNEA